MQVFNERKQGKGQKLRSQEEQPDQRVNNTTKSLDVTDRKSGNTLLSVLV